MKVDALKLTDQDLAVRVIEIFLTSKKKEDRNTKAKLLLRALELLGYRFIPELKVLGDEEIRIAINKVMMGGQLYGDDGQPLPEKAIAQAQRDYDRKQIKGEEYESK